MFAAPAHVVFVSAPWVRTQISLICTPASAQEVQQEIVLTAQKPQECAQTTAICMAVQNEAEIDRRGVTNMDDLATLAPTMCVSAFGGSPTGLRVFLRGLGLSDSQATQDPPMGAHLNGVYVAMRLPSFMPQLLRFLTGWTFCQCRGRRFEDGADKAFEREKCRHSGYIIGSVRYALPVMQRSGAGGGVISFTTTKAHRGAFCDHPRPAPMAGTLERFYER